MVQTRPETLTLEEFLQLPETKPASEYLDGAIAQKPMSQGKHSRLQIKLATAINAALEPEQKRGEPSLPLASAFPELRCTFGSSSIVPDIAVVIGARIPRDESGDIANVFVLAPDWSIEISSPGQDRDKVAKNLRRGWQHGTQMGWLIDPERKIVLIDRGRQEPETYNQPDRRLPVPPFASELQLTVREVFAWPA